MFSKVRCPLQMDDISVASKLIEFPRSHDQYSAKKNFAQNRVTVESGAIKKSRFFAALQNKTPMSGSATGANKFTFLGL